MRIKWGFLTSLTVLALVVADPAWGEETTSKTGQTTSTSSQVPLPADLSYGWSTSAVPRHAAQPASYPAYPPPAAQWAGAGAPAGAYGGFPGSPLMPASFQEPTEVPPQLFPGPAPDPYFNGGGGVYEEGGAVYEDEIMPPYPGPFDGWVDERGGGLAGWLITGMRPFGEGGICAPRWYDVTLDAMFLTRENAGRNVPIASDGPTQQPPRGIVLSTSDLDFEARPGFRFNGAIQVGPAMITEFTYFGLFNWTDSVQVFNNQGSLFSFYSNFGNTNTNPPGPFNGFDATDRSGFQEINFSSRVDNFELNFRRRWSAPNCQFQGSWLAGVRYIYQLEDFGYVTTGGDTNQQQPPVDVTAFQNTEITARNSLTGFQVGADLWSTIIPGVSVGAEVKGGVFGNYANQRTQVSVTNLTPLVPTTTVFLEEADFNDIAFAGEGRVEAIYRTGPNWTFRAGYTIIFLEGLALATENINRLAPPNLSGVGLVPRSPAHNDDGNALYHGGHAGIEYVW